MTEQHEAPTWDHWAELTARVEALEARVHELQTMHSTALSQSEPESAFTNLAARPLLEKVARMGDCIGQQTVGEIAAVSSQASAWLDANPPGQPAAIEPRGCPTPGACSCVEPLSPAAQAVLDAWLSSEKGARMLGDPSSLAAALRAAVDQVLPARMNRGLPEIRAEFLAIAAELDGGNSTSQED